jgi:hypothetical protein
MKVEFATTKPNAEYISKILFAVVCLWQETIPSDPFGIRTRDTIGYQIPCLKRKVSDVGV